MAGELMRRATVGQPVSRATMRAVVQVGESVVANQAVIRAKARVGESAMYEIAFLKGTQRQLEMGNPELGEALALIANTTVHAIARSVAYFGETLG